MILKFFKTFIVRSFGALAGLLLTVSVTNIVSSEEAGLFLLYFSLINFISIVLLLGVPQYLIRFIARADNKCWNDVNNIFSFFLKSVFLLIVFVFFGVVVVVYLSSWKIDYELIVLIGISSLFFSIMMLFSSAILGMQKSIASCCVQNVISQVFFILIVCAFYFFHWYVDSLQLLRIYMLGLFISAICGGCIWFQNDHARLKIFANVKFQIFRELHPFFIVSIMILFTQWIGQFSIAVFLNSKEIAFFSAAQRVSILGSFILIVSNLLVAPKFANAYKNNDLKLINIISLQTSRIMLLVGTPVAIFIFIFPEIIMSFFGHEYMSSSYLLRIMIVGQYVSVLCGSVSYLLTMTEYNDDYRNIVVFSGCLSIASTVLLTWLFSSFGTAIATSLSISLQFLLSTYYVNKHFGFNNINIFRKV